MAVKNGAVEGKGKGGDAMVKNIVAVNGRRKLQTAVANGGGKELQWLEKVAGDTNGNGKMQSITMAKKWLS